MALSTMPPEPPSFQELETKEYNRWLEQAASLVRSAERTDVYESMQGIISNDAFVRLSAPRESGYPSLAAFAGLAPSLRKSRLIELVQDVSDVQKSILEFLHTIPKENAHKLIGQLMLGRPTGLFLDQLEDLESSLATQPHTVYAEHAHPEGDYLDGPIKPKYHAKNRPEDAIKNADRAWRRIVSGEEAGG